ncbi:MAG: hypothetical protein Q7S63_02930 [bacterium]|nr:hypothetical protein [bacterium]
MDKKKNRKSKPINLGDKDLRQLGVMIESVHDEVRLIAEQYGDIKETLHSHTEMIGSIMRDVEIIKMDIEFIKGAIKTRVGVDEFAVLERRVALLERHR